MEKAVLKATRRNVTGKQVKTLRRQGLLPAVLYGTGINPISVSLDAHDASLLLAGLSSSTLVNIDLEGEEHSALVREKQRDFLKNVLVHVDFHVVSLAEKIRAMVRVEMQGSSDVAAENNAVLFQSLNQIEVEAFPQNLPERIILDVSKLENVGDAIYVRDLGVSDDVTVLTSADEVVVIATAAAPEEVEEVEPAEELTEPELIERGKQDDEEEGEGEE
jgi:large subunit ribosomal protein L25